MDELFQEMMGVDSKIALEFFYGELGEMYGLRSYDKDQELSYVASVLAHYAQTSRSDGTLSVPLADSLSDVFDLVIMQEFETKDPDILEISGSHVLLLAGFFRQQMSRRHNVKWYDQIGQSLYFDAARYCPDRRKRLLFEQISDSFPEWTGICSTLQKRFWENRFLLRLG